MKALSILIVDDAPSVRGTYAYIVRKKQCHAVEAASIPEAREALSRMQFDIVISDYHLKGGSLRDSDGNLFLREVASQQPSAYRVLASGAEPPADLAAHEFIVKGNNTAQIFAIIEKRQATA